MSQADAKHSFGECREVQYPAAFCGVLTVNLWNRGGMMRGSMVYDFLGGIEHPGYMQIPLIPLGRWLLGLVFILFVAGIWLGEKRSIAVLEQVRYGSRKRWWNAQFWRTFQVGAAGCLGYGACMLGLDCWFHLLGWEVTEWALILVLWMVHMEVMVSLLCLLDITKERGIAPALLSMTEVLTFSAGFFNWGLAKYMFGNWGMYVQSNRIEPEYGFSPPVVLVLECLLIMAAWKSGMALIRRRENV